MRRMDCAGRDARLLRGDEGTEVYLRVERATSSDAAQPRGRATVCAGCGAACTEGRGGEVRGAGTRARSLGDMAAERRYDARPWHHF